MQTSHEGLKLDNRVPFRLCIRLQKHLRTRNFVRLMQNPSLPRFIRYDHADVKVTGHFDKFYIPSRLEGRVANAILDQKNPEF